MIWDAPMPSFPTLEGDISCDVLVIGGGVAGLLTAHRLHQAGVNTVLVEGNTIASGITRTTTAVLSAQHDSPYSNLIDAVGSQRAYHYLHGNLWAVKEFRSMCAHIACDFQERPSYMYSTSNRDAMRREIFALGELSYTAKFVTDIELPVPIRGAVMFPDMAQFHPLKFLAAIAKPLTIYEHTFVSKIKGTIATTQRGTIHAKKIIVATHYPFINRVGMYPAKLFQQRSYVSAFRNAQALSGTYLQYGDEGLYFRDYNGLLLVGGSDHRTGTPGTAYQPMENFTKSHYPNAVKEYSFAGQDCMSLDALPYVGPYSPWMPNLFVVSGFNLWGMSNAMLASHIMCDTILKKKNPYAAAFAPTRSMFNAQLLKNVSTSTVDFFFPTTRRCPHMGCALKYNPQEHSWDCPCHGSRFDQNGKLLDSPAMRNL